MLPGGSGYFTCKQNMNLVTTKFKSGGLHEKYVVATWNVGNHLSICLSLCRLKERFSLHKNSTPPHPNHTVTQAHIEPEQYNTWNKSTVCHKLLKMDVLTFETCWAVNCEIIKRVTWSWPIFIQLSRFYNVSFSKEAN